MSLRLDNSIQSSYNQSLVIYYTYKRFNIMFQPISSFDNWEYIKDKLLKLKNKLLKPQEIHNLLKQFKFYSHRVYEKNAKTEKTYFIELMKAYSPQLPEIYSKVADFVCKRSHFQLPLFVSGQSKQCRITKEQILYLYCTMLLMLIPRQLFNESYQKRSRFNYLMDFSYIFEEQPYKTRTVIEYIKQEIDKVQNYGETFIIRRNVQKRSVNQIIQEAKDKPMAPFIIEKNTASIEDYYGYLKADFANKFIGGGALMSGCVQQEIMFSNHPQCFTSQLLCQVMEPNESIHLFGFKKYSKNKGYGWQLAYDGQQKHKYEYDENRMAKQYLTAIDAIHFAGSNIREQFTKTYFDRELLKAYVGFNTKQTELKEVVTGNWGCGCFNGDLRLKFLIQWLACSLVDKKMTYCPFGSKEIIEDKKLLEKMSKRKVAENYSLLIKACEKVPKDQIDINIYSLLNDLI